MNGVKKKESGFISWAICVVGWLLCATFCLLLTVALEIYPLAYEMFFPAIILILFCNIFIFLFVGTRRTLQIKLLLSSVARVCIGEGLILAGLYAIAKYMIAS